VRLGKKKKVVPVGEQKITNLYGDKKGPVLSETVRAIKLSDGSFEPLEGVNARPEEEWDWK